MSFDRTAQFLFGLFIAFFLVTIARALGTGRYGYGAGAVARAFDPVHFWHSAAIAAALPAALAFSLFDMRAGSAAMQGLLALALVLALLALGVAEAARP